jgi:hypothetical protein
VIEYVVGPGAVEPPPPPHPETRSKMAVNREIIFVFLII